MRKIYLNDEAPLQPPATDRFTSEHIASVAVTSESPEAPVENLFAPQSPRGWRAAGPGKQTIRLTFERSMPVRRIQLSFSESARERTQEFALSWSKAAGEQHHELVRQRWNFSPSGSQREQEDFRFELNGVLELELTITPDVSGGDALASLDRFDVS